MAKQQPPLYTTSEEIENLKKTNQVSVVKVFVEGPDDFKIFNSIVKHKDLRELVEISNRGGRTALLELQEEYLLQKSKIHQKVLFFADQDTWVFTGIPEKYQEVHFTKGYSIENDLFEDGETVLMSYLSLSEKKRFEQLIDNLSEWFASQVKLIQDGRAESAKIDFSLFNDKIIASGANTLNTEYQIDDNFRANERNLIDQIKTHYCPLPLSRNRKKVEIFKLGLKLRRA